MTSNMNNVFPEILPGTNIFSSESKNDDHDKLDNRVIIN